MTQLLEAKDLEVTYRSAGQVNHAVNGVTIDVGASEVVGIVGESGSGKSSAALAVLGLTKSGGRITAGSVSYRGRQLLGMPEDDWQRIRGAEIAFVPQNPRGALNPVLRVGESLIAVYRAHNAVTRGAARARAVEMLKVVGINDPNRRFEAYPHELSGGMAQRVMIAAALICDPTILLADEPTSGLDVTVQAQILDDLQRAVRQVGSALVLVTQDLGVVANYCDRVYVLHAGEVVEHARTEAIFAQPSHPATVALLAAQRGVRAESVRLRGLPIDGRDLPSGCYLSPRCPFADEDAGCRHVHPRLTDRERGHEVRCHRVPAVLEQASSVFAGQTADTPMERV